jgi:hypothetical protein
MLSSRCLAGRKKYHVKNGYCLKGNTLVLMPTNKISDKNKRQLDHFKNERKVVEPVKTRKFKNKKLSQRKRYSSLSKNTLSVLSKKSKHFCDNKLLFFDPKGRKIYVPLSEGKKRWLKGVALRNALIRLRKDTLLKQHKSDYSKAQQNPSQILHKRYLDTLHNGLSRTQKINQEVQAIDKLLKDLNSAVQRVS